MTKYDEFKKLEQAYPGSRKKFWSQQDLDVAFQFHSIFLKSPDKYPVYSFCPFYNFKGGANTHKKLLFLDFGEHNLRRGNLSYCTLTGSNLSKVSNLPLKGNKIDWHQAKVSKMTLEKGDYR